MEIRLTLRPGMAGTKKLLARNGERLVCVRYRYDRATGRRVKTAELIVPGGRRTRQREAESDHISADVCICRYMVLGCRRCVPSLGRRRR